MAQELDRLLLRIDADMSALKSQLKSAEAQTQGAATKMTAAFSGVNRALGALGVGVSGAALVSIFKNSVDAAGGLGELAAQAGVSTDSLQELVYAGSQVGLSQEQMIQSVAKFNAMIGDAAKGNATAIGTFESLGVKILDASGKLRSTDDILGSVADAIAALETPQQRTAAAMEIWGDKIGRKLVPFLESGAAGLAKFREEAHLFGLVIDKDGIRQADELSDAFARIGLQIDKTAEKLALKLVPWLNAVGVAMQVAFSDHRDLDIFKRLRELDKEIARMEDRPATAPKMPPAMQQRLDAMRAEREALLAERQALEDAAAKPPAPKPAPGVSNPRPESVDKYLRDLRNAQAATSDRDQFIETKAAGYRSAAGKSPRAEEEEEVRRLAGAIFDLNKIEEESKRIDSEAAAQSKRDAADLKDRRARKEDVIAAGEREVEQNEKLLAALGESETAYEKQKAYYDLINDAKRTGLGLTEEEEKRIRAVADALGEQKVKNDRLKESYDEGRRAATDYANAIGQAFEDAVIAGKSWRDAMIGLLQDVQRTFLRVTVTKPVEGWAKGLLTSDSKDGPKSGSDDSSSGGLLSGIGAFFGSLFGGARAAGGDGFPGKVYRFNENGAEYFKPSTPGRFMSASETSGMAGGGVVVQQTNYFSAGSDRAAIERAMPGIIDATKSAVFDARKRGQAA